MPIGWLSTDSRTPRSAITTGDARVGAWLDEQGRKHLSKSYFAFDISNFRTATVFSARAVFPEVAANDCAKRRQTEVWELVPHDHTTSWADQPQELNILPSVKNTQCLASITYDATDAVKRAIRRGDKTITLAVRIAEDQQGNVAFGRTYSSWRQSVGVEYNTPPNTPTGLGLQQTYPAACPDYVSGSAVTFTASTSDPDGHQGYRAARWAFWPVDRPAQRVEQVYEGSGTVLGTVPQGLLVSGTRLAVAVRDEDGYTASAWTAPCVFTYDNQAPAVAPGVSSTVYPEGADWSGGENVPGEFVFTAGGVDDVVSYQYEGSGVRGSVAANGLGGSATITVTPEFWGFQYLDVTGVDRAGNRSPTRHYTYMVRPTSPTFENRGVKAGEPTTFTLTARQPGAVSATYRLENGPETTVPLDANGTAPMTVTVPTLQPVLRELVVWTTDASGHRSRTIRSTLFVDQALPQVEVTPVDAEAGAERVIGFTAARADVVSFSYRVKSSFPYDEFVAVPAVDGKATAKVTPAFGGYYEVEAYSTLASGERTGATTTQFYVTSPAPTVTSAEYPENATSGAPGQPGAFRMSLPGAMDFVIVFEGRYYYPQADADGAATVELTPTNPGPTSVSVTAMLATWEQSPTKEYAFTVGNGS
ncbi:hypothetical protein V5P93_005707 [Actinokineospora auranticolor]|uniref:hypothetical protein n=1 Tax=Actinokineospora auranticolor TaxID=155976 RepID=UPI000CEB9925|nr:hypothetical protein [Actinokineospora auranticolor]